MSFTAWTSFPGAPFASGLVLSALQSNFPQVKISTAEQLDQEDDNAPLLQWSTYDALSHEKTLDHPATVLSSSYTIRKSLIRKHFLHRALQSYTTKHPDSYIAVRGAVPKTWDIDLSWADELDEMWGDELWDLGNQLDQNEQPGRIEQWFILKPSMSDRGMGIRLFESKETLRQIFEAFEDDESDQSGSCGEQESSGVDTSVIASQLRHFVIQEYIPRPLLLDPAESSVSNTAPASLESRKFHIRAYCVASGALKLFVNPYFLALFAGSAYNPPHRSTHEGENELSIDLSAHLTNTSLQTPTIDNPDPNDNVRLLSEMTNCRIFSSDAEHHDVLTAEDVEDIVDQVCNVLADAFRAALESSIHFQPLPNAFELFGADLLVSHTMNSENSGSRFLVSLLELNAEPAIELTGARLSWILESMFSGICKACVAPFFATFSSEDDWEVGETRHGLRKCLDVQVRGMKGW